MDTEVDPYEVRLEAARRAWGLPPPMGPLTEREQSVVDAVEAFENSRNRETVRNTSRFVPRLVK